jgi:hypothetical protein
MFDKYKAKKVAGSGGLKSTVPVEPPGQAPRKARLLGE